MDRERIPPVVDQYEHVALLGDREDTDIPCYPLATGLKQIPVFLVLTGAHDPLIHRHQGWENSLKDVLLIKEVI